MSFKCTVINSDVRKKYCTNFNDTKCKSSFIGQNFVYFGRKYVNCIDSHGNKKV